MTKEEVKEYIDNYISHIISMVEYGNWFADEINEFVEDVKKNILYILTSYKHCHTKKISNQVLSEIDKELQLLEEKIDLMITEEIEKVIEEEDKWLDKSVFGPLNIKPEYPKKSKELLLLVPIATAGIIGQYGKTVSDRLKNIYEQEVMQSYVTGSSFDELKDDFESRFNTFDRGLEADSETLGSSLSGQYDRIVYTKNDNIIPEYMWLATLDGRTCLVCSDLDHTIYKKIEDVPIYAKHSRCRCTVAIVTPDIKDNIPESYETWFESQPKSEKYKILGKTRFQLYENGMKIKSFVNNGKKTPLKDLKK